MQNLEEFTDELHNMSDAILQRDPQGGNGDVQIDEVPIRFPIPFPWLLTASGLYEWKFSFPSIPIPGPWPHPGGTVEHEAGNQASAAVQSDLAQFWFQREELRLDIDGRYPLMKASGTLYSGLSMRIHWIANLEQRDTGIYAGYIWYKDGDAAWLPHTNIEVKVTTSWFTSQRKATITFTGGGSPNRVRTYKWQSGYFHPNEFEYDTVAGTNAVTQINTGDHPNRPASLATENISIETCFRRAGFDVKMSGGNNVIPIAGAGADNLWTDMEMHDAMQIYWLRFANKAQWSMWVLFAWQHAPVPSLGITPDNLGGIMFDSIGPNHRQGTAIFNGSFIKNAPDGDASPAAWVRRMKFWTAVHEMGHAFNLAHSWQKSLGTPWIPLTNQPEVRSFMNYPYRVSGGESAFFSDFDFRFSDEELLFMRHAPQRFVQMGNADWFDNHGFQQANASPNSPYALEVRVHRTLDYFEFMEPVIVELKLTNRSSQPLLVNESLLNETDDMTVIIKKQGRLARQWRPFAQYCHHSNNKALAPGESLYSSLEIATGINGWDIAEPGVYTVQVALHMMNEDVVSNVLQVRVAPPRSREEEFWAQDFFTEDVGRVLAFKGSRYLDKANDTLHEVVERFSNNRIAHHARTALGNPLTCNYKLLNFADEDVEDVAAVIQDEDRQFNVLKAQPDVARDFLREALLEKPTEAADTLGHIEYRNAVEQYSAFLAQEGESDEAAQSLEEARNTLADRSVLKSVLKEMDAQQKQYAKEK